MASNKVIINAGIGQWYPKGTKRLVESLANIGWHGDVLTWDKWPNDNYDKNCPYNVKASAFEEAIKMGYKKILWVDSSVWAVRNPQPIFDIIENDGFYFIDNGFNCAQTCSDKCLDYFKVDRNKAEQMPELASGIFGINTENKNGSAFIDWWIQSAVNGVFKGSREHDMQSNDERFLFYRQDQSVASIIANELDLKYTEHWGGLVSYEPSNINEKTVLTLQGM